MISLLPLLSSPSNNRLYNVSKWFHYCLCYHPLPIIGCIMSANDFITAFAIIPLQWELKMGDLCPFVRLTWFPVHLSDAIPLKILYEIFQEQIWPGHDGHLFTILISKMADWWPYYCRLLFGVCSPHAAGFQIGPQITDQWPLYTQKTYFALVLENYKR